MGGGGFLGLGPAPSAPAAPDYSGAAQATAAGNIEAARVATAANRVNQVTPYGNLNYAVTGSDPYGNPTWTATQTLSHPTTAFRLPKSSKSWFRKVGRPRVRLCRKYATNPI
jgi:hypothetical protein